MKEVDVAKPVEKYLEELGYKVRSEVNSCDITAVKGDQLLVVECKTAISLKLIYQAIDRQEFSDSVYIAVPVISGKKLANRKHLLRLIKRLELGLILVHQLKTRSRVEIVLDPKPYNKRRKLKKRSSIIDEINSRSENYNTGGSRGRIMTAYKETSLDILKLLEEHGPLSAKELKKMGTPDKTYSILYKNFYGWFVKSEGRGKFYITEKGRSFLRGDLG